jgi:glycosyltransferase involved in cell wall biosynthesis
MKPIFFSFIIPARNEDTAITGAISSILLQSYQNFEIIVVNNGSTDTTAEKVLEAHAYDPRVHLVDCPEQGILYARQAGLDKANGYPECNEYVFQMDARRRLPKGCLSNAVRIIKRNPGVAAFCGAYRHRDAPWWLKLFELFQYPFMYFGNIYVQYKGFGAFAIGGNFIIKKSVIEKVGYEKTPDFYFEDLKTARRVASEGTVKFCWNLDMNTTARTYEDPVTHTVTWKSFWAKQGIYNLGTKAVWSGNEFPSQPGQEVVILQATS